MSYTILKEPPERVFADNEIWLRLQHPAPSSASFGTNNVVRVLIETPYNSSNYVAVQDLYCPFLNTQGLSEYNLRDVLRKYVIKRILSSGIPNIANMVTNDIDTHIRYKLAYYEFSNGALTGGGAADTSGVKHAYIGGLQFNWDEEMEATINNIGLQAMILTNRPQYYTLDRQSLDFISYISIAGLTPIYIHYEFEFEDGTTQTWDDTYSGTNNANEKYHINISPAYFYGAASISGNLKRYTWQLRNPANGDLSKRYYVEMVCCNRRNKHFLFMNSLGGYDGLMTSGQYDLSIETDQPIAQRTMRYNAPQYLGSMFQYSGITNETIKVQSDWQKGVCNYRYWQDLLQYIAVKFEYIPHEYCDNCESVQVLDMQHLRPILIPDQNVKANNGTNNEHYRIGFSYRYAFDSTNHSPNIF